MLLNFTFGNVLSFRDQFTLNFSPDALKEKNGYLHTAYKFDPTVTLLKSIAIYGHNSHGKSNLIKAYDCFLRTLLHSHKSNEFIEVENFRLNTSSVADPTFFEASFYVSESKYRFGFKIRKNKIIEEWLYYSEPKVRENYLFLRADQEIKISKTWSKESGKTIDRAIHYTKQDQLLLSTLFASNEQPPRINKIYDWLNGNVILNDISGDIQLKQALLLLANEEYRPLINKLIDSADLGFTSIIDKIDSYAAKNLLLNEDLLKIWYRNEIRDFSLFTTHNVYNGDHKLVEKIQFEVLKNESAGTLKFLMLACFLVYAIKQGQLILIDEIDSKFHSLLLKVIIEFYNDEKNNVNGSQLIFTTHNTVLLNDVLRRDQICLVEKNDFGESSLKKAHSSQSPIRIDTTIEKEYRKGKLGGISKKILSDKNQTKLDF